MFELEDIENAFYRHEFFLEYLPTMHLADNRCIGAEALLRWRRGDQVVAPMDFIPQVEATPLVGLVTYRVIELVAQDLGPWLRAHDNVHIAINVPPELLGRGGLWYALLVSGLADVSNKIMAEVSERGMPDLISMHGINAGRKYDVQIALDDVNVNECNLLALMYVHTDIVKFEKSLVDQMLRNDWSDDEIADVAALVRTGKCQVIAEGVETIKQVNILKNAGVQMAQGWYFSHPLPASDFIKYFSTHQH